jgi:acetyl esterase
MQVDAATRAFLEALSSAGGKPLNEQTISEARDGIRAVSQQLGGPPVEVHRVEDRVVRTPSGDFRARLYWPSAARSEELFPIVLLYHGGGFVVGDLDSHDNLARYLCKHGDALVVSVEYRLAPEHKFPTAVDDSYAALLWAVEHARELGADPGRIAVTGDSAGGNLAAVVCQLAKERKGPRIAYQALLYPCTDLDPSSSYPSRMDFGGGEYFLSNADMRWFTNLYFAEAPLNMRDPRASPLRAEDASDLPPALVVTAGCDLLRDEGKAYADKLQAAGVPVEYRCFDGTIHAFISFHGAIPIGAEALSLVADRLRKGLRP